MEILHLGVIPPPITDPLPVTYTTECGCCQTIFKFEEKEAISIVAVESAAPMYAWDCLLTWACPHCATKRTLARSFLGKLNRMHEWSAKLRSSAPSDSNWEPV